MAAQHLISSSIAANATDRADRGFHAIARPSTEPLLAVLLANTLWYPKQMDI